MVSRVSLKGLYGRVRLQDLYGRVILQGLSWGDQTWCGGQSGGTKYGEIDGPGGPQFRGDRRRRDISTCNLFTSAFQVFTFWY